MSPAIRVVGRGGTVAAEALTTARSIQPDSNPVAGRLVVQNDRIAKGIVEGALAVRFGKAGESITSIGGDRCAGNVDGVKINAP